MAKILIISAVFPPEPVVSAQISEGLANELAKKHDVTVLCPKPTRPFGYKLKEEKSVTNYEIQTLSSYTCPQFNILGRFRESYSFGKHCMKFIKYNHKNIDCIYLNSWPLFSQYFIIKSAKRYRIKSIIHIQDIYPESLFNKIPFGKLFNIMLRPLDQYILNNSTSIIAIADKMKSYISLTRKIVPEKITVIHNWQDESIFVKYRQSLRNVTDIDDNKPFVFMYLGNNGPLAGVELLIRSFVLANIINSKLIIAGSGSMTGSSKELVKLLKIDNIEFIEVPEGAVPQIQDLADVMLLPIKKKGAQSSIPSKLPAYMFSAKPIIGSLDLDSETANAIKASGAGIVVESENEEELSKAMKQMANWSREKLMDMGIQGFNYAIEHYSRSENLSKMVALIEKQIL